MMLDKKQILVIFSFEFKMDRKVVDTTCNINKTFGPGTANEHIVQWWFKMSCKEDNSIENEECRSYPLEVDKDQVRGSSKLILLQLQKKLLKHSTLTILWSLGIWSSLGRWKNLAKWVPHEIKWSEVKIIQSCPTLCDPMDYIVHGILRAGIQVWVAFPFTRGSSQPRDRTQVSPIASGFFTSRATREAHELTPNQKKCLFKVFGLLLFYVRTMNNFSIALWHTMKSGFYTATSDDQLTKSSKTFLKAKFAPKKKKV